MKSLFYALVFLFYLTQINGLAQTSDSSVVFEASWHKGDIKRYKITKSKMEYRGGKASKNETNTYMASFRVLAANKRSYLIEYQYENQLFSNTPAFSAEVKAVIAKHPFQRVKYTTDEYGSFKGVENWKELSTLTKNIFAEVAKSQSGPDKETLQKVMKPLAEAYSSKEGIEGLLLKELSYFHSPYGGLFSLYDTIAYEDALPNFFGGDPIKANGSIYFVDQGKAGNTCKMINELTLDDEDALRMVEELFLKMSAQASYKTKEEPHQKKVEMKMDIKDYNTYLYNTEENWPIEVNNKRKVLVHTPKEKLERIDEIRIELVNY